MIDLDEVAAIYLPLSRLLNLYVSATQDLQRVSSTFLGSIAPKVPYVIGVAGSVAVGKSTFARILQALLSRWPDHPQVDLVTTDGFLHPNAVLAERDIMDRKGFPESYDTRALLGFLRAVKSGEPEVGAPVYDHVAYDILDGVVTTVRRPDIVIVEGLNVLQVDREGVEFVSDYFDFSIYVDADVRHIEEWYVQPVLRAARVGVPQSRQLLQQLRRPHRRGGRPRPPATSGAPSTARTWREHRPDAGAGQPHPPQGGRPPCQPGPAPQALTS